MDPQRLLAHQSAVCASPALAFSHFAPDDMVRHLARPAAVGQYWWAICADGPSSSAFCQRSTRWPHRHATATVLLCRDRKLRTTWVGAGAAFCPQAMGAGRYMEVGLLAQRGTVCCLVVSLPIWALWWNITPLLELAGQPPDAVAYAARSVSRPRKHRINLASAPAHRQYPGGRLGLGMLC